MVYENEINLIKVQNGTDGVPGEKGSDGKTLYTWVKYSQYADGTDLTDDPTDAAYIGIAYNKEEQTESNNKSDYTWSKIKGEDGQNGATGATGKGIKSIVPQYYLSTSNTTQTGGSWSTTVPNWVSGKYIWTRNYITWSDDTTSTTTAVLDNSLNGLGDRVTKAEASIKTNSDNIELKVSKNDIISSINQSAEQISIDANKINLNGAITANEKVKIMEDGRLVAEDGEFSGTIKSNNAVITGGSLKIETSSKEEDVMSLSWTSSGGYEWNSTVRTTGISATMKDPNTGFYQSGALTCGGLNGYQQISNIDDLCYSTGYDGFRYWKETNNGTNMPNRDYYYIADSEGILAKSVKTTSGADLDSLNSKINSGNIIASTARAIDSGDGKLIAWVDGEGGNIEIGAGNGHTNFWQFDAYNGNLRAYTFRESDQQYMGFEMTQDGIIYTSQQGLLLGANGIHIQPVTVSANSYPTQITAPEISGFAFKCWIGVASQGFLGSPYIENMLASSTNIFDLHRNAEKTYTAWALYLRVSY